MNSNVIVEHRNRGCDVSSSYFDGNGGNGGGYDKHERREGRFVKKRKSCGNGSNASGGKRVMRNTTITPYSQFTSSLNKNQRNLTLKILKHRYQHENTSPERQNSHSKLIKMAHKRQNHNTSCPEIFIEQNPKIAPNKTTTNTAENQGLNELEQAVLDLSSIQNQNTKRPKQGQKNIRKLAENNKINGMSKNRKRDMLVRLLNHQSLKLGQIKTLSNNKINKVYKQNLKMVDLLIEPVKLSDLPSNKNSDHTNQYEHSRYQSNGGDEVVDMSIDESDQSKRRSQSTVKLHTSKPSLFHSMCIGKIKTTHVLKTQARFYNRFKQFEKMPKYDQSKPAVRCSGPYETDYDKFIKYKKARNGEKFKT